MTAVPSPQRNRAFATTTDRLAQIATSLVTFANTHTEFADHLATRLHATSLSKLPRDTHPSPHAISPFLLPRDFAHACQKAHWVISEIDHRPAEQTRAARHQLVHWLDHFHAPQDAVLGIVGIAIIGPTLGLIKKKKRRKSALRIITTPTLLRQPRHTLVQTTQQISLRFLSEELALVQGDSTRLDPDVADWCFADHETRLYTQSKNDLADTLKILEQEALPHHTFVQDNTLTALAISPAVRECFLGHTRAQLCVR